MQSLGSIARLSRQDVLAGEAIFAYDRGMETHTTTHEPHSVPPAPSVEHIIATPGVCGGKPRIAGHRIRVQDVALWHERLGYPVVEIVARYPQLTPAEVHAALAYYYDHRAAIQQDIRDAEALVATLKAHIPSKLCQKLNARDAGPDTLPPG
jgi:uncharacterized protein (DUF433 family)